MKKVKFLLVIFTVLLVLPFGVFAEGTAGENARSGETTDNQVNLYFFHGDGCPHCEDASTWFEEIEDEYGKYFNLVSYEVWYNTENSSLMEEVAKVRGETADGVPYIIVGNKSWSGFADQYKEEILDKIKSEYDQDVAERYDVMDYVDSAGDVEEETNYGKDALILIILVLVVGGICTGVAIARKKTN